MLITVNGKEINLPDFFIVGVSRSGTTSFNFLLKQHPQIFMPPIKEPFFFNGPYFGNYNVPQTGINTIEKYIQLFEQASKEQVLGEATTMYLYFFKNVISNLRNIYGERYKDIKIIICLRNPAERAFSHYKFYKRDGLDPLDFEEAIKDEVIKERRKQNAGYDYVGFGMYYEQVKAYMENFSFVKVFIYEDFVNDNLKVIKEIFGFLDVDDSFTPELRRYNVAGRIKSRWLHEFIFLKKNIVKNFLKHFLPLDLRIRLGHKILEKNTRQWEMPPDLKKKLNVLFKDDIHNLQHLLGKNLSFWINEPR